MRVAGLEPASLTAADFNGGRYECCPRLKSLDIARLLCLPISPYPLVYEAPCQIRTGYICLEGKGVTVTPMAQRCFQGRPKVASTYPLLFQMGWDQASFFQLALEEFLVILDTSPYNYCRQFMNTRRDYSNQLSSILSTYAHLQPYAVFFIPRHTLEIHTVVECIFSRCNDKAASTIVLKIAII